MLPKYLDQKKEQKKGEDEERLVSHENSTSYLPSGSTQQAEVSPNEQDQQLLFSQLNGQNQLLNQILRNRFSVFALVLLFILLCFLAGKLFFGSQSQAVLLKLQQIEKKNQEMKATLSKLESQKQSQIEQKNEELKVKITQIEKEKLSQIETEYEKMKNKIETLEKGSKQKNKIDQQSKGESIFTNKQKNTPNLKDKKSSERTQKTEEKTKQDKFSFQDIKQKEKKSTMKKVINPINIPDSFPQEQLLTFSYPTVGIPEPGKLFNKTRVSKFDLALFDHELNQLLKPYNDTDCEFQKWGESKDGSYIVCKNYFGTAQGIINIGINGFDLLGCQISSDYKIPNYQYECYDDKPTLCPTNNGGNEFFRDCLGAVTKKFNNKSYFSLESMLQRHNLTKKHIIFKIDCEGCEYPGLKYFPTQYLDYIDQILVEFHFAHIYRQYWGTLDIFRTLASKFVNLNYHTPHWLNFRDSHAKYRRLPGKTIQ